MIYFLHKTKKLCYNQNGKFQADENAHAYVTKTRASRATRGKNGVCFPLSGCISGASKNRMLLVSKSRNKNYQIRPLHRPASAGIL